jgi:HAD superfamily hydrolase (TIGR01549 family)
LSLGGVRAILFDLDGTLRHRRPSYNHALFQVATQFGVPDSNADRRNALRWAHLYFAQSPQFLTDLETFAGDNERFMINYLRLYLIAYGCASARAASLAPRIYEQLSRTLHQEDWVDPIVPVTLEKLQQAGYTLGVVSNRRKPFLDVLETLDLAPYFEFALASGEVDSWKPDPAIFHFAMERAGSCPDCTIYVGDNYYADVIGALAAGIQPVLLDPEGLFPEAECYVVRSLGELG